MAATLAFQGLCAQAFSEKEARALAEESLAILRRLPVGREMIYALQLLANLSHDEAEKTQIRQECLAIAKAGQSGWWIPVCMIQLSDLAMNRSDYAEAKALLEEVLILAHENNYQAQFAQAFSALSQIAMLEGKYAEARSWAHKALTAAEDMGYTSAMWWIHSAIADNALLQGDYFTAQTHYQNGLAICLELNERRGALFQMSGLGCAASGTKDYPQARRHFYDALRSAKEMDSLPAILDILSGTAGLLAATDEAERALQLAAYVLSQQSSEHMARARSTQLLQSLETTFSPEIFMAGMDEGKRIDIDETIRTLLAELNAVVEETRLPADIQSLPDPLTERELEVLRLIADGLSNYDIAVHLFLGVSTVKTHINRIFSKLCVKNRTQAVALARELRLL